MKTRAKRLAAIFLAAVMTAAMAVPAFAAPSPIVDSEAGTSSQNGTMYFTKEVDVDANTYHPSETFEFNVEGAPVTGTNEQYNGATVYAGNDTTKVHGTITASPVITDPNQKGTKYYKSDLDFSNITFDQPGIYKFTVTEKAGNNKDMKYDTDARYLYVFVKRNGTSNEIYGVAMSKNTTVDGKNANIKNEYKKSNTNGDEFKDLTIEKRVTGEMGDTDKLFNFTLTITSGSGRTKYHVSKTANGSSNTVDLTTNQPYTFSLKNGDSIVVENLSTNDSYTIAETDYTSEGYHTTYKTQVDGEDEKDSSASSNKSMANKNVKEIIINERNTVTPTGIVMSYGPYILMIAAAAVLGFVFLRRREEI